MKRKPYFCQNTIFGDGHKAKYFDDLESAKAWLKEQGGGTIKKRNAGVINDPFIGEIRTWGEVSQ